MYTITFYNDKRIIKRIVIKDVIDETKIKNYAEKKREEIAWNYGLYTEYRIKKEGKNNA